jgi:hypothetical protein
VFVKMTPDYRIFSAQLGGVEVEHGSDERPPDESRSNGWVPAERYFAVTFRLVTVVAMTLLPSKSVQTLPCFPVAHLLRPCRPNLRQSFNVAEGENRPLVVSSLQLTNPTEGFRRLAETKSLPSL